MDFTLKTYQLLLSELQQAGYEIIRYRDYCESKPMGRFVILRHDIDKSPHHAFQIAKIDAAMDIRSTFFWLTRKKVFHPDIIKKVAAMGHEIGYHYRDWVDAQGDSENAIAFFEENLYKMRELAEIKTIAMDGSPWSRFNNQDIWKHYDYRTFGIIGEPYFDIFGAGEKPAIPDVFYLTDTGRMWNGRRYSLRDRVNVNQIQEYHSTFDIIHAAQSGTLPHKIMITTHPQRWTDNKVEWVFEFMMQGLKNIVKGVLVKSRANRSK